VNEHVLGEVRSPPSWTLTRADRRLNRFGVWPTPKIVDSSSKKTSQRLFGSLDITRPSQDGP
jgi:hypothetical protein